MRGTPFRRTILTWACILSLTFAGCAANRSTIPPDVSPSKTIHALAVIPWEDVPEFNVVRMGNSRMVGALRGAGRGFLNGAAAVAQGIAHGSAGLQGGSGGSDAVVLAVFAAVMLSVGAVNAVIEGVKGSWAGAPYEKVSDPDDATQRRLASLRIQEGFARLMKEEARKRLHVPILPDELPAKNGGDGARFLRELNDSGIDAALRVGIARVAFEGRDGKDQPLSVVVTLRAEIVRTMDGARIFETTLEHRSAEIPPEEWAKDDFLRLVQELDEGVRDLAKRCVDDILGAGLVRFL
ncbi:MAG: hypothetical protein ACM319_05965 [Deltaproteobacteria bacterium]|nr:hypothetical protein [Candidatus Deferrimicrobiaceae bacterium]